jgi:RNA polymerase sigma factor (sigma-70 family)
VTDLVMNSDVQHAMSGDREAFIRLIRDMKSDMFGLARSLLNKDEDCADVMQETILKAYRSLKTLREPAYFRTWVFRILIRECQLTYRRRKMAIVSNRLPDIGITPKARDLDLQSAVNRLNEKLRTVVILHYYSDLPLGLIANMLNVSEGTLKSRLHKARRQLAKYLGSREEGDIGYGLR